MTLSVFMGKTKKPTVQEMQRQIEVRDAQLAHLKVERDFWVEQSRALQNQLQTVLRSQAGLFEQMARSTVMPDDVHAAITDMASQLRQPLTTVEAVAALASSAREGTQGGYTAVKRAAQGEIER